MFEPQAENPQINPEIIRKKVILDQITTFFSSLEFKNPSDKKKVAAQIKLEARFAYNNASEQELKTSPFPELSASGFQIFDMPKIATNTETGFLQLGKVHSNGASNEGGIDFFDRWTVTNSFLKFTECFLVYDPAASPIYVEQITQSERELIESIPIPIDAVLNLRRATDILYLVLDTDKHEIAQKKQEISDAFPQLAPKIISLEEFSDLFDDKGRLDTEQDLEFSPNINLINYITRILAAQGVSEVFSFFVLDKIFPQLSTDERMLLLPEVIQGISIYKFDENSEEAKTKIDLLLKNISQAECLKLLKSRFLSHRLNAYIILYLKKTKNNESIFPDLLAYLKQPTFPELVKILFDSLKNAKSSEVVTKQKLVETFSNLVESTLIDATQVATYIKRFNYLLSSLDQENLSVENVQRILEYQIILAKIEVLEENGSIDSRFFCGLFSDDIRLVLTDSYPGINQKKSHTDGFRSQFKRIFGLESMPDTLTQQKKANIEYLNSGPSYFERDVERCIYADVFQMIHSLRSGIKHMKETTEVYSDWYLAPEISVTRQHKIDYIMRFKDLMSETGKIAFTEVLKLYHLRTNTED